MLRVKLELLLDDPTMLAEMVTSISKYRVVKLNAEASEHTSVCSGDNRETAPGGDAGKQIRDSVHDKTELDSKSPASKNNIEKGKQSKTSHPENQKIIIEGNNNKVKIKPMANPWKIVNKERKQFKEMKKKYDKIYAENQEKMNQLLKDTNSQIELLHDEVSTKLIDKNNEDIIITTYHDHFNEARRALSAAAEGLEDSELDLDSDDDSSEEEVLESRRDTILKALKERLHRPYSANFSYYEGEVEERDIKEYERMLDHHLNGTELRIISGGKSKRGKQIVGFQVTQDENGENKFREIESTERNERPDDIYQMYDVKTIWPIV